MTPSRIRNSPSAADEALARGRAHDVAGRIGEAVESYAAAIELADDGKAPSVLAEALRRLAVLHHRRAEAESAANLCHRSYATAVSIGSEALAAEALNTLAGFALEEGHIEEARARFRDALILAGNDVGLAGKIEQNLGIAANMQGDWTVALQHYRRAQELYERAHDRYGAAIACHNLGMIHADQKCWPEARRHFVAAGRLAAAVGDTHLGALALLGQAQVHWAEQRYDAARADAETALATLSRLDARRDRASAHRILGMIFRDTGRAALATSHLQSALEIAAAAQCPLTEADAARELAELHRQQGRRSDAMVWLNRARTLYKRLDAIHEVVDVEDRALALGPTPIFSE
ncbi:MAG TPA: tetratricopeptide repeat protein [Gemmatimonadales bacterium]|nr:tetratricopeptide repeat protein [Gemmatimonadales bacterium]